MKTALVFLFLSFTSVYCYDSGRHKPSKWSNMKFIYEMYKLKEKIQEEHPDMLKLFEAVFETHECVSQNELGSQTYCARIRNNYHKCAQPIRTFANEHISSESEDLLAIFENSILDIIEYVCDSSVEQLLELLNPCREHEVSSYEYCKNTKSEDKRPICSMLSRINCKKAYEAARCPNPITKEAIFRLYDAIGGATEDYCAYSNKA